MDNPFGITQVDIPGLLGMHQQMKRQRLEDLYRAKEIERQDHAEERQAKIDARTDKEYDRTEKVRTGLSEAYDPNTGTIDPVKARATYVAAGDIPGAMSFDKSRLDAQKAELETYAKINENALQLLGGVHDQASYDAARAQAKAMYEQYGHGQHFPDLPTVYDPRTIQDLQMRALSGKEQIAARRAELDASERERHNRATEGVAAGNLALSRQREGRITKWGPQPLIGVVNGAVKSGTDDLDY
jgi:hypothetical protein